MEQVNMEVFKRLDSKQIYSVLRSLVIDRRDDFFVTGKLTGF
jgi:hypothetical protein